MYQHILIPTDGSALSETAITQGVALAKALNARIIGITATSPFWAIAVEPLVLSDALERWEKDCEVIAEKRLDVVRQIAKTAGVPCETVHVHGDDPAHATSPRPRAAGRTSSSWPRTDGGGYRPSCSAARPRRS